MRLVDRVAYINHDIDDAVRAGILAEEDLPAKQIDLLGPTGAARIDTLVRDIVETSREAGDIAQSEEIGGAMLRLRKFMFDEVYLGEEARSEHDRVHRTLSGLFDHYLDGARAGGGRAAAGHRLHSGDDRPVRDRDVQARGAARGVASSEAFFTPGSVERVKEASDIVEVISAHTDLQAVGDAVHGAVPVSRRALAVVLRRPDREALPLLRLRGGGRRDQVRRGEGGAAVPRGGRGARRPLRGRARARGGGSAGRGAAAAAGAADRAAGAHGGLLRDASCATRRRRRGRATTSPGAGCRPRRWRSSGSAARRGPGTRCWSAASRPAIRSRRSRRPGWC